jgi:hypothetical protein
MKMLKMFMLRQVQHERKFIIDFDSYPFALSLSKGECGIRGSL